MSRGQAGPDPPLPGPGLPAGFIWPADSGRALLKRVPFTEVVPRGDLVGRQGLDDGSGTSDILLFKAGGWCLKTSLRRRFADVETGRAALLALVRKKRLLETFLAPETVVAVVPEDTSDGARSAWLWTVCPWWPSLRQQMAAAVEQRHEAALASSLAAYATAAVEAMLIAARRQVQLDVHPSNFALTPGGLWYLDDDIGLAPTLPAIGHALLQRVEEYGKWSAAVDIYLAALEEALASRLSALDVQTLGLAETVEQTTVRSAVAEAARTRLRRAIWRCRPAP